MVIIKKGKNTKTTVYINLDINKVDKMQFKSFKNDLFFWFTNIQDSKHLLSDKVNL